MISSYSAVKSCAATVSLKSPDNGASLETRFNASLDRLTTDAVNPRRLLIALSGGVDSVVLLSLTCRIKLQKNIALRAVYVDHGLQVQSADWSKHCEAFCNSCDVSFDCVHVDVDLQSGLSPEAAARDARYDAFKKLLQKDEYLCTAHHADDQAETLLLQLFRGAGVNGLASMPELRAFGCGYLLRPLLQASRDDIVAYANARDLKWVEDPSNKDARYDRNYLRHELLPALEQRWPGLTDNIARSASHCAEASALTKELALLDGDMTDGTMPDGAGDLSRLSISQLQVLSAVRQKNLLRVWIAQCGFLPPSTAQLQQILTDLIQREEEGAHGFVSFGEAQLARYQQYLYVGARGDFEPLADFEYQWTDTRDPLEIKELGWQLDAMAYKNLQPLIGQLLVVRNRRGGERWRADSSAHSVSVKSLLQQRRIPPWQRSRILFVYHHEKLVHICAPDFEI